MMLFLSMALAKPGSTYLIPFPTTPIFDGEQRICMDVDDDLGVPNVEVEDGPFLASCATVSGHTRLCLTLLDDTKWPEKFAELECEGESAVRMRPILAFDPLDDISDGVEIVRGVSKIQAAFRTPDIEEAVGILAGGHCFVIENVLTVILDDTETRHQTCVLVLPGDKEQHVPIKLVSKITR